MSDMLNYYILRENVEYAELELSKPGMTVAGILSAIYDRQKLSNDGIAESSLHLYKPKQNLERRVEVGPRVFQNLINELEPLGQKDDVQFAFGEILGNPDLIHLLIAISSETQGPPVKRPRPYDSTEREVPDDDKYNRMWNLAWGKPLASSLTEVTMLEDGDLLPMHARVLNTPLCGNVLLRAEYIRIYNFIEACLGETEWKSETLQLPPAVVITGQPGIGKTVWISYALCRRLGEKHPTLIYASGALYLFSDRAVERVFDPLQIFPGADGEIPWCFIDSVDAAKGIPDFANGTHADNMIPIYVTPPNRDRWKSLHQAKVPYVALMNPWTWEEMDFTSQHIYKNRSDECVRQRFKKFGPSTRICLSYRDQEMKIYENDCMAAINQIQDVAHDLEQAFLAANALHLPSATNDSKPATAVARLSHKICLLRRQEIDVVSDEQTVSFVSKYVANPCALRLAQLKDPQAVSVWELFSKHPDAREMMGQIFESYVHLHFRINITIEGVEMFRSPEGKYHASFAAYDTRKRLKAAYNASTPSGFKLSFKPVVAEQFNNEQDEIRVSSDVYYQPEDNRQAGIDSFFVHDNYLYLLQMTGGKEHGIEEKLEATLKKLKGVPAR